MANKLPQPREGAEQATLFHWAGMQSIWYPELELLFHIPNGGKRSKSEAARFKAEGVKPGVPDICLPVARAIELFKAGATARRVAAELGIAEKTARKIKSEAGLTRLPTKWDKAREMFEAGASSYTIAEAIGVKRKTVMNWASKEGLKW